MIINKKTIASAIATGTILLSTIAPAAFAADTITVTGNGASSDNSVEVSKETETNIVQNNSAEIKNEIEANASTGGNDASYNTGGNTSIMTGNANSTVNVANQVNANQANVNNCDTCNISADVLISGNGANSRNEAELKSETENSLYQSNKAEIKNELEVNAKTGYNDANYNTGGDTSIFTGNAKSAANVSNIANANIATIGENGVAGVLSAQITGNGASSDNEIEIKKENETEVVQNNWAEIKNEIEVNAKTGYNDANYNTNGDVLIGTGNANARVDLANLANFNFVDLSCCLVGSETDKISGNGADSRNEIEKNLESELSIFQNAQCAKLDSLQIDGGKKDECSKLELENELEVNAKTGYNDANNNTGPATVDPVGVLTGNAGQLTTLSNTGGVNEAGLIFSFDLGQLLSVFGLGA